MHLLKCFAASIITIVTIIAFCAVLAAWPGPTFTITIVTLLTVIFAASGIFAAGEE